MAELGMWHMPIIPAPGGLTQKDRKFRASLEYEVRPCSKHRARAVIHSTHPSPDPGPQET